MNTAQLGELVRLRYKLLWAKTRSRNGRIALFFAGYVLLALLFVLLISGGFGAGMAAVRSGESELVAQVLFGAIFLQALVAAIALGFGMNTVFSDLELRRYPVSAHERRLVRHFIGIADPFWMLFLLLQIGIVSGLYVVGGTPLAGGLVAVALLFVCNYLAARILNVAIDRLMEHKSGGAILMVVILAIAILPSMAATLFKSTPWIGKAFVAMVKATPPFGAAAAATHWDTAGFAGMGLLAVWVAALVAVLTWLEMRPRVARREDSGKVSWDSWYERLGALFPAQDAPFVAHWLRFYMRNGRFRTMYLLTLPLAGFLMFNSPGRGPGASENSAFAAAVGIFTVVSFLATSRISVNQYGYVGGGFRRFFLLPADAAASLRAGAYASMLLGGAAIPFALAGWAVLAPGGVDARKIVMLLGSGFSGMFFFHGVGIWVSMLNPRKGEYQGTFGNDLSLWGNIVVIGGMVSAIFIPQFLSRSAPSFLTPEHWWASILTTILTALFFFASLRAASPMLLARRERLLAIVEGRD